MIDAKSFRGRFLLYRKRGKALRRPADDKGGCAPRLRHETYDAATLEAERLLEKHPTSTFVILQEVGRVKLRDPDAATGCADDQAFARTSADALRRAAERATSETLRRIADGG